jgi:hypothetical protein
MRFLAMNALACALVAGVIAPQRMIFAVDSAVCNAKSPNWRTDPSLE